MPTKKVPAKVAKKEVVKKSVVKKEVAPKKEAKPKSVPKLKQPSSVKLVSFSVTAVIPTQQYGNIQPKIEVTAGSIEEARAVVMPLIEDLYKTYAETPLNGREPKFYGKVTETEKVVDVTVPAPAPKAPEPVTPSSPAPSVPSSSESPEKAPEPAPAPTAPVAPSVERSAPFLKAEKAIQLATSHPALDTIEAQIKNSVKIDPNDKPELLNILQARKNEVPF